MKQIKDLLTRDPFREITSVIRLTDHDPRRVWAEMDEYVPTDRIISYYREVLDVLADTRRGPTERVCIWISGFFGSGKSHFLKVLGYLLGKRNLQDPDGHPHSSCEFLCRKLKLETFLPLLEKELTNYVLFINLLDYDPQDPRRPTISRSIYQNFLKEKGLSTDFWVAEWEKEFQRLDKWDTFREWVQATYKRSWEEERILNADVVLRNAIQNLLPDRYHDNDEAKEAIENSKRRYATISPSELVRELNQEAKKLHPQNGRVIILLDEVGLYIGESIERLTDLNSFAEQVVQQGDGKVLLIATAQEALTDLIPRLTADRQILEWLRDRFRLRLGLEPTEVQRVVSTRLLSKKSEAVALLKNLYESHQGKLLSNLSIERAWTENDFVERYPFSPYAVKLVQDIMGTLRGSVEEARRLSGSERSILKLVHAILTGEGGIVVGANQNVGWLVSLDLFYDALAPDLTAIRADQVRVIREIESLGDVDGLSIARIAKALFLLQQLRLRYPCGVENLASALVDQIDLDFNQLCQKVSKGLQLLKEKGWVIEEEGQYRLLTPAEHDLEKDVRMNYPGPARLKQESVNLIRQMLSKFTFELGQIKRPLKVALNADGETISEEGDLFVELFTPLAEENTDILAKSIREPNTVFWEASRQGEIKLYLERTIAIEDALKKWTTRALSRQQEEHKNVLVREAQTNRQSKLPQIMEQAFLKGRIIQAGQEIKPAGSDMISVLRAQLHSIAGKLFSEFVDERPEREEDCAAILTWQPGAALPVIFSRLGLLTPNNQIHQENKLLSTIKAEIKNREQKGLPRSGKDVSEQFEKKPFGWDPRLLRLLLATLFKGGIICANYQNRDLTNPNDPQAKQIFVSQREFNKAIFMVLPEVDWRKASELCSTIFGVKGEDTFERTAATVQAQARQWANEAQQLYVRCQDNGLPSELALKCQILHQKLNELSLQAEANTCLRRFLEIEEELKNIIPTVRSLKLFSFEEYRKVHNFLVEAREWARELKGDAANRWNRIQKDLKAQDIIQRWSQIREDYSYLLSRYREAYMNAHSKFQAYMQKAFEELKKHPAFESFPDKAEMELESFKKMICDIEDFSPNETTFTCSHCQRRFVSLSPDTALAHKRRLEAALDDLMPQLPPEKIQPLSISRIVSDEQEIENISGELSRYLRKAQNPIDVMVTAQVRRNSK